MYCKSLEYSLSLFGATLMPELLFFVVAVVV